MGEKKGAGQGDRRKLGWHLIRPQQFKPGIGTPEGQTIAIKACGEAAKAKLDRPNFDHYSFFMPREMPRVVTHYTPQQAANMAKGMSSSLQQSRSPCVCVLRGAAVKSIHWLFRT